MVWVSAIVTEERVAHALQESLEVNLPLFVTVVNQVLVVQCLDLVMELTGMSDTVEVDQFAWDGTSDGFTLWNITISGWELTTEQFLQGFAFLIKSVAFDAVFVLKLGTEWDQFFSEHWNQLLGILPLADIVVDLVEEGLATDAEVLQVALVLVTGAVTSVA